VNVNNHGIVLKTSNLYHNMMKNMLYRLHIVGLG
jgi:hypothetical protein